jgi:hypothetical protein
MIMPGCLWPLSKPPRPLPVGVALRQDLASLRMPEAPERVDRCRNTLVEWLLGHASSASDLHLRNFGGGAEETAKLPKQADLIVHTLGDGNSRRGSLPAPPFSVDLLRCRTRRAAHLPKSAIHASCGLVWGGNLGLE